MKQTKDELIELAVSYIDTVRSNLGNFSERINDIENKIDNGETSECDIGKAEMYSMLTATNWKTLRGILRRIDRMNEKENELFFKENEK